MSLSMMLRSQKVLMLAFFVTTGAKAMAKTGGASAGSNLIQLTVKTSKKVITGGKKATAKTGAATIANSLRSNFEDMFASLDDEFDCQQATAKTGRATIADGRSIFEDPFASLDDEFDSQQRVEPKIHRSFTSFYTDLIDNSVWSPFYIDFLIFAVVVGGVRSLLYLRSGNRSKGKGCTHEAPVKLQQVAPTPPLVPVLPPLQRHAVVDFAPLMKAARTDDKVVWTQLVEDMDDVILTCEDVCQCTALHVAAQTGCVELAKVLLQRGCNANAKEAWDETPLHFAARSGSVDICKMLVALGARINAVDASDVTPLIAAARASQEETCEFLLEKGAGCGGLAPEDMPPLLSALLLKRMILPRRTKDPLDSTSDSETTSSARSYRDASLVRAGS